MAISFRNFRFKFLELIPLLILIFISLNGNSMIYFKFVSINLSYIIIYFWVLRKPEFLGYGFIFLSGLTTDVVLGLPLGVNALVFLVISGSAAYVRVVTVTKSLFTDWVSFIPALLLANIVYFLVLYFSDIPIQYLDLFKNSIFTFIAYPFLWIIFSTLLNFMKA